MQDAGAFTGICHRLVADGNESQIPAAQGWRVNGYLSRKQKVQSHDRRGTREPLGALRDTPGVWEQPDMPTRAETN